MKYRLDHVCKRILKTNILHLVQSFRSHSSNAVRVPLHNFHAEKNARFVDFAGFLMPLHYGDQSLSASHKHTREHVSVFDVSHMLQTKISGKDQVKFIESLVVSDIEGLHVNQGTLTVFTNDKGGIIDDLIVTKTDRDYLYLVSNAGCTDKDLSHMNKKKDEFKMNGADIELEIIKNSVLLAIQGPGTAAVLQELTPWDLSDLTFMTTATTSICGVKDCRITRCGYTGEDGVEISIPAQQSEFILETLLNSKKDIVKLAGLGARDTLRLEAGLCLYGNDITDHTTPIEAGLAWTIGKRRRETGGFPGDSLILKQLKDKPKKKRVGFISEGPCPRASTNILNLEGGVIGTITSGCPSPCLKKNVSMGYVDFASSKIGNKTKFLIHRKEFEGTIVIMPFLPSKYYTK